MTLNASLGRKRMFRYIPLDNLHHDTENPRLPKEYQGKPESDVIDALYKYFHLQELAISMAENGYFEAEPIVGIPVDLPKKLQGVGHDDLESNVDYREFINADDTHFIVVEGNRRLCAAKLLLSGEKATFPELIDDSIKNDLQFLPTIIYPERKDVLAYLGARHIIGTKKWDAYAKARYIASLRDEHNLPMDDIQRTIGDAGTSTRKIYVCYRLIEIIESQFEDYETDDAKDNFSYLVLGLGQGSIKDFLDIPSRWMNIDLDNPIAKGKYEELKELFIWFYGEGKKKKAVIKESRDITNKLSYVLRSEEAITHLRLTNDIDEAFERTDGEQYMLLKYLKKSNRMLGNTLPLISKHKNAEVIRLIDDCKVTIDSMYKILG